MNNAMTVTQNNDLTHHVGIMNFNLSSVPNNINPLNAELNPICHLLALLGGATIVVVSRLRVKNYIQLKWLHLYNLVSLQYPR
jgi:hypothetical protein